MRSFVYFLLVLLISQCKQKDKNVYTPMDQETKAPTSLMKQHESLLAQARLLAVDNDSSTGKLHELMEYHFREEEQYVFPVLSILPVLATEHMPEQSEKIVDLTMRFKANSAKLLAEHQMIKALLGEYRLRGNIQNDTGFDEFEKALAEHATAEEEIYFPIIIVIGDYLKLKSNAGKH